MTNFIRFLECCPESSPTFEITPIDEAQLDYEIIPIGDEIKIFNLKVECDCCSFNASMRTWGARLSIFEIAAFWNYHVSFLPISSKQTKVKKKDD